MFKSRKSKAILIAFVLLLCGFCTIITAAALFVFNSNKNIPYASDVVEQVENRFVSEEQFDELIVDSLETYIHNEPSEIPAKFNGMQSDFNLNMNAAYEGYDVRLIGKGKHNTNKTLDNTSIETNLTLDIADMQFGSDLEVRLFQQDNKEEGYVKFENIPDFLTMAIPGIDQLNSKWISTGSSVVTNTEVNEADRADVIELVNSQEFKSLISRSADRVFGDVRTYCVAFDMNQNQFKALSNKYQSISGEKMDTSFDSLKNLEINIDLCVGRRDQLPYYVNMSIKASEIEMSISFENFVYPETPVVIVKPEGAEDLSELFKSFTL